MVKIFFKKIKKVKVKVLCKKKFVWYGDAIMDIFHKNETREERNVKEKKSIATRLLSIVLAAAMAVTLLPEAAFLREEKTVTKVEAAETKTVKFKAVSMGNSRCAAISENGDLYCWGLNNYGQIGNGTTVDQETPVKILSNVKEVEFRYSGSTSVALTENGDLYCWGWNGSGQIGNGSTENQLTPEKILTGVTQFSCDKSGVAAITEDGSLYCWGDYAGNGTQDKQLTPAKIMENAAKVSYGCQYDHAVITENGDLYCWGLNYYGSVGNGTTSKQFTPVKVLENVAEVKQAWQATIAITKTGDLYSWGNNQFGTVGNGSTENQLTPVKIMSDMAQIDTADEFYVCAAVSKDRDLYTWGRGGYHLGNGSTENQLTPVKILDNVVKVDMGAVRCAAIKGNGDFYSWGDNYYKLIRTDSDDDQLTPLKQLENIKEVSVGYYHTAVITEDGDLYVWGAGVLGNNASNSSKPEKISITDDSTDPDNPSTEEKDPANLTLSTNPDMAEMFTWGDTYTDTEATITLTLRNYSSNLSLTEKKKEQEAAKNIYVTVEIPDDFKFSDFETKDTSRMFYLEEIAGNSEKEIEIPIQIGDEFYYFGNKKMTIKVTSDNCAAINKEIELSSSSAYSFVMQKENNSFSNGYLEEGDPTWTYATSDENLNKLAANQREKDKLIKYIRETEHTGSCSGISALMGLVHTGKVKLSELGQDVDSFYELKPVESLRSTINYYQLFEQTKRYDPEGTINMTTKLETTMGRVETSQDTINERMHNLVMEAKNGPVLLKYYSPSLSSKDEGHAVLVVDAYYKDSEYTIRIVDPNEHLQALYWKIPAETMGEYNLKNSTYNNKTFDWLYFDYISLDTFMDELGSTHADISTTTLSFKADANFTITAEDGSSAEIAGGSASGSLIKSDITFSGDGSSDSLWYSVEIANSGSYQIKNSSGNADIEILNKDIYASISATNMTAATVSAANGVKLSGSDNMTSKVYYSVDGMDDSTMACIEGEPGKELSISVSDGKLVVDGTKTDDLKIDSFNSVWKADSTTCTHQWSDYQITEPATVFTKEKKERTCFLCKKTETVYGKCLTPTIKVNVKSIPLQVKQSTKAVKVTGLARGDSVVSWKSSNKKIVKVNKTGKITAQKKKGTAYIIITLASGKTAKVRVKVQKGKVKASKITLNVSKLTLKKGKKYKLKATVTPVTCKDKVKYKSSKKSVVTVDKKGNLKAKKKGTAKIIVSVGKKRKTIKVKVK